MAIVTKLINHLFAPRLREIETFRQNAVEVQRRQFQYLVSNGAATEYGKKYGMDAAMSESEYRRNVPIVDYEMLSGYIERMRRGESNVLWSGTSRWFAKSSGTTGSKSKYIPVTQAGLQLSHMRGPKDIMALYCNRYPDTKVLGGKMLTLGGSKRIERESDSGMSGDLSAILIENTPTLASVLRLPDKRTALIPDFDEKVQLIAEHSTRADVRSFTGVPSWNLVMLNRILEYTGKHNILEVWPDMELFVHGGMDFRPYESQYRKLIPSDRMRYLETYNASEGFFAMAEEPGRRDMLLMLDYGTYYEFLPTDRLGDTTAAIPLEGVSTGVNYAMIISSCNGLWRYMIGDTVQFVSTNPYTIRVTGRTKHYINAFGEEVIVDNAEYAIHAACRAAGAEIVEYTVAPVYMESGHQGSHEWIVEFARTPKNMELFTDVLDAELQRVNSDYEAKRYHNATLMRPRITAVPRGTFEGWLRQQGKVGGQNKVPRLCNDRTYADKLIEFGTHDPKPETSGSAPCASKKSA